MDKEIERQLAIRDNYRRKLAWAKTPEQRMSEMRELQKAAFETLRQNPEGYAHFLQRNYQKRSISGWDRNDQ
jgi:hypothetical protein